jgi:NitT/TauT family transport system substrate-binding protein
MRRILAAAAALATAALVTAGCSNSPPPEGPRGIKTGPVTVRLGFVTNLTQATALLGIGGKIFTHYLGPGITVRPVPFASETAEVAALAAGKLDAAYASPAAILAVAHKAGPASISIISGAASGGTELVVKPAIHTPAQLKGTTLAVPAASGGQDIALRYWLQASHLPASGVTITTPGTALVHAFTTGRIAGAWEPAPYDVELANAGGRVLVDEASLWPSGQYATANLVVTHKFLDTQSGLVFSLLKGQIQATEDLSQDLPQAAVIIGTELKALTHTSLPTGILIASLAQITFTSDPLATSLTTQAQHASALGLPQPAIDLTSLYDLAPLNLLLRATGQPPASP